MKDELKKLRTRWRRWLGQMQRGDRSEELRLLDSNYQGWRRKIAMNHGLDEGKATFRECIDIATLEELGKLDILVLDERLGL